MSVRILFASHDRRSLLDRGVSPMDTCSAISRLAHQRASRVLRRVVWPAHHWHSVRPLVVEPNYPSRVGESATERGEACSSAAATAGVPDPEVPASRAAAAAGAPQAAGTSGSRRRPDSESDGPLQPPPRRCLRVVRSRTPAQASESAGGGSGSGRWPRCHVRRRWQRGLARSPLAACGSAH
jgi:hypothetical protein